MEELQMDRKKNSEPKRKIAIVITVIVLGVVGVSLVGVLSVGSAIYYALNGEVKDSSTNGGKKDAGKTASGVLKDEKDEKDKSDDEQGTVGYTEYQEIEDAKYFTSASASSTLPNQSGHNYDATNVLSDNGACWCEGAEGFGEGEWIKLELPSEQRLYGLEIKNGYAGTERQYTRNAKMRRIRLEFSNGQSMETTLDVYLVEQRGNTQTISFGQPIETSYVKITILSVVESECMDTCLTYVKPYQGR